MFAVVELLDTKELMIIATEWFANEKKTLVNVPVLDENLELIDPAFKKLRNMSVFKQNSCKVLYDDIENMKMATQLLDSAKKDNEENKNKRKNSSENGFPIKKRRYSLNLDDKLKGNDMENETDDTVEPREEILLVQISDIESDQGSNVGDPISKENQSSDDAFFKDQIFMKIHELETKIDCLIEHFGLNGTSMEKDPVVPELDFKTLEDVTVFDERLKLDQQFLNKMVHYFIYRVQSGRFHKAYYGKVACMLKRILNPSIYSAFKYSRKNSSAPFEGDDDQQKVSFELYFGILNLILEVCNHKSEEIVDDRGVQNAVYDFFQKFNKATTN